MTLGLGEDAASAPAVAFSAVPRHRAFVGMGGNLGDVLARMASALSAIKELPATRLETVSPFYKTRPVEAGGPDYCNAVAVLSCALGPAELLRALLRIEQDHDRERPYPNAPRTLDLDLLWYGGARRSSQALNLPHPRMGQRAFVLQPLADVLAALPDPEPELAAALPGAAERQVLAEQQGIELLPSPLAGLG